jgi:hypothetical protein
MRARYDVALTCFLQMKAAAHRPAFVTVLELEIFNQAAIAIGIAF